MKTIPMPGPTATGRPVPAVAGLSPQRRRLVMAVVGLALVMAERAPRSDRP